MAVSSPLLKLNEINQNIKSDIFCMPPFCDMPINLC